MSSSAPTLPDDDRYSNQIVVEYLLMGLRTNRHLRSQSREIKRSGNIATFPNAIIISPSNVLATTTSIETGAVLPADSVTVVEWETADNRIGHWRGQMAVVVGNPTEEIPETVVTPLHDPKADAAKMHHLPYAETIYLDNLSPADLQRKVDDYSSQMAWERDLRDMLENPHALARLRQFLATQSESGNLDRRASDRNDLLSEVTVQMIRAIKRFASPARPIGAGSLTTYLPTNVKRDVKRATMRYAGVPQAPAEMLQRLYASDIDPHQHTPDQMVRRLAEDNDAVTSPSSHSDHRILSAAARVDLVANAVSLSLPTGTDGDGLDLSSTIGDEDDHYGTAETSVTDLHRLAVRILLGSRVPVTDPVVNAIATWIGTFLLGGKEPTPNDLENPGSGWPTAMWVFTPLLRSGEDITDPDVSRRLRKRIERMMLTDDASTGNTEWRSVSGIRKAWSHHIESPRWMTRPAVPPVGVAVHSEDHL